MVNPFEKLEAELAEVKQLNQMILERLDRLNSKQEEDRFLSIDQTRAMWQPAVSRQSIYSWEKQGLLTRYVIGNKPCFLKSEVILATTRVQRYKKQNSN